MRLMLFDLHVATIDESCAEFPRFLVAGKQRILSGQADRPDGVFDRVGVEFERPSSRKRASPAE